MRNFPPHATMTELELLCRFTAAVLPLLNTQTAVGNALSVGSSALAQGDIKTALERIDSAVELAFAQGYATSSPEAWIAAITLFMLRY